MFASNKIAVAGMVAVVAGVVSAAPNPTEPSAASVFKVGDACTIKWDTDATGTWTAMNIELMTGDNLNMIHLTTVAEDIDATADKNTFTYTCPDVTPNSAIYFYQFSDPSDPKNLLWTTRWTMAGADGSTTPPTETTQPGGGAIPWGKGALVDPSTAVAAPSYLGGSQSGGTSASGSAVSTATGSVSASASSAAPSASASASAAPSGSASASRSIVTSASRASAASGSTSRASTASAASPTSSTNAALGGAVPGMMAVVGAVLAAVGMF